ncbi:hypothetical protein K461DRAFT_278351 [Myriangium duriaei CBS 260.36]|uniref:Uncharacterized protein n=1 Tax=Myriangium duriaei CBS 260.36 TaxID=1168546 RepID=A0A9P4J305_9PEZI|nr:hypothetical protein K461DRAFT_278351 [Myriangium duriaei CBS 260.36]
MLIAQRISRAILWRFFCFEIFDGKKNILAKKHGMFRMLDNVRSVQHDQRSPDTVEYNILHN